MNCSKTLFLFLFGYLLTLTLAASYSEEDQHRRVIRSPEYSDDEDGGAPTAAPGNDNAEDQKDNLGERPAKKPAGGGSGGGNKSGAYYYRNSGMTGFQGALDKHFQKKKKQGEDIQTAGDNSQKSSDGINKQMKDNQYKKMEKTYGWAEYEMANPEKEVEKEKPANGKNTPPPKKEEASGDDE